MDLDDDARQLLELLVRSLPTVVSSDPRTFLTYGGALRELKLSARGRTAGAALEAQGLGMLANWTVENGLPGITGLIVDRKSLEPGKGYFTAYGRLREDYPWWREQIERSIKHNWTQYLNSAPLRSSPTAVDLADSPSRAETVVSRIIRDGPLARRVKTLHQFRCQICGQTIFLRDGSPYAEAHHIRPLGAPHNGQDVEGNILCLCPNHHVEMDYVVKRLDVSALRIVDGHQVDQRFVDYHNEMHDRSG